MKKILVLVLVIALTFGLFVGCGDKETDKVTTAEEMLEKVSEASKDVTNAEFKADFDLEISGLEALGFAGPMGLEMNGKIKDHSNMMIQLAVDTGQGMTIEADLYLSEEKMMIYAPLLQMLMGYSYIELGMDTITETAGVEMTEADSEKVLAILDRFEEESEYSLYDILILSDDMEEVEVVVNDTNVDATKLSMTINLDDSIDMLVEFMKFVVEDAEAKELFFKDYTDEDLATMTEEFNNPETIEEAQGMLDQLTINTFEFVYYINDEYIPVKFDLAIDVTVDVDGEATTIKLNGAFEMFNFGDVKDIEFPEVDPAEVMNADDLLNLY